MVQKKKKMDTKVIAMVGAVIVVGAAVYGVATGTVLPGSEEIDDGGGDTPDNTGDGNTNDGGSGDEGTQDGEDSGDDNDVGDEETNVTSTENGNETDGDSATETGNEEGEGSEEDTETEEETPGYVCEERSSEFDIVNRHSAAGPPFDPFLFESMLHDEINELREIRTDAELLKCDPELREVARGLSDPDITAAQPAEVCENPRTRSGAWYYQRDMELNPPGRGSNQRVPFIANHEDLVLDVRGAWGGSGGFVNDVTDRKMTRQGIGAYIDRDTRRVVVTQVLCGEESTETSETS
jgi:hypothetical protein